MKIVVVSSTVIPCPPPGYSGLEQLAWLQAKGLAERGHDVTLIAPDGSSCPGVRVACTGPPGQWDEQPAFSRTWQLYLECNGSGAIIDNSWAKYAYMLKAEGVLTAPVLGVTHGVVNASYKAPPPCEKPCWTCISEDQANHLRNTLDCDARVAYNGVDPEFYKSLGVPRSGRFLFLARFSTVKSPHIAIEACKAAGVGLDLVGDTSITNEPEYLEQCKRLCDGKQIRMVGGASRGECVWWFSQAHALIHPNKHFREPFGLAPVEAMLCGTPVIAWDNGAMRETVQQGATGVLVKSEEELVNVVRSFKDQQVPLAQGQTGLSWWYNPDMREGCRAWAERFSVTAMIDRYEQLCQEAVATGGW